MKINVYLPDEIGRRAKDASLNFSALLRAEVISELNRIEEMKTQKQDVLEHLLKHGSLTRIQAIYDLGIIELPARICELEKMGYQIPREDYSGIAKNGRRFHSVRYLKPVVPL